MASKGWFNLEAAGGVIPDTQFFEGDSAFKFLGLTRTQRLYGFIGWYVVQSSCEVGEMPCHQSLLGRRAHTPCGPVLLSASS